MDAPRSTTCRPLLEESIEAASLCRSFAPTDVLRGELPLSKWEGRADLGFGPSGGEFIADLNSAACNLVPSYLLSPRLHAEVLKCWAQLSAFIRCFRLV